MKKLLYIIILLILIENNFLFSWDSTASKYMPLQIGNVWVYSGSSATLLCHGSFWLDRYEVTGIVNIYGKKFYQVSHSIIFISGNCGWTVRLFANNSPIRVDSATQNIYVSGSCGTDNEILIDSLNAGLNDQYYSCNSDLYCIDTSDFEIFGQSKKSKLFRIGTGWETIVSQRYAENIGMISYYYYCGGTYNIGLKGCLINGILYGDTSIIVGIKQINSDIPGRFSISQNYPNPFNPVTKIKFEIPASVETSRWDVLFTIYDALGKEVQVLVNQQLQPGTYSVDWDASAYPSGVYYYKLETQNYSETKKMVLIK